MPPPTSPDKLRIELTKEEQDELMADVAVVFSVGADKNLTITAEWGAMDELYSDGCVITIPSRVWKIAAPWIAERII